MKFNELSSMMQKPEPKPDTYEAGMALNQLLKIGTHAIKIHNMIDNNAEMEAWVAKKIDLASNYVKSVHGYTAGSKAGTYDDDGMTEDAGNMADMNKYGIVVTKSKDGDFDVFQRDKPLGSFKSIQDVNRFLKNYLDGSSSLDEDAGEDKDVEKAKQIAKDKAGDMTRASQDIDKVKKGLSAHPDVADALKRANEELNRITKLAGLGEGADFYGYYKDPKDPEGKTFTYPNNMEFKTPHRSNANARMLLSRIGLDPDFENTGSHLIDDFIAATDKYLRMNVSDKDTNEYDEVEMYHVEANRIKKTHPEVTHVGFN